MVIPIGSGRNENTIELLQIPDKIQLYSNLTYLTLALTPASFPDISCNIHPFLLPTIQREKQTHSCLSRP